MNQRRSNVVLSGQRVASGDVHFGSAGCKHLAEVRGLSLKMYRERYAQPCKGLFLLEFLFDSVKQRHVALYPRYFACAAFPEVGVSYFVCHVFLLCFRMVFSN